MFKRELKKINRKERFKRNKIKKLWLNYFKNLFMSNYEIEGLDYKQSEFLLSTLWERGTVCAINTIHSELYNDSNKIALMNYQAYGSPDIYSYYNQYQVISNYLQPNIDYTKVYNLDEDIVIGWATKNHEPIFLLIETLVEQIVEDLVLIDYQRRALKMPFAITCMPEEKDKYLDTINRVIEDDEPVIILSSDEIRNIEIMNLSPTYIIDKLRDDIKSITGDIKSILGLKSLNIEKKERLITSEAESNNDEVETNINNYVKEISSFFDRVNAMFGLSLKISVREDKENIILEEDREEEV